MQKAFSSEGKLARAGALTWQLMILNLLTLAGCAPVVTAGAALSAMHYVLTRLIRGEENSVPGMFWRAFKANFKQGTLLWIVFLATFLSLRVDWVIVTDAALGRPFQYGILIAAWLVFMIFQYVFPLQSHFENTVLRTIRNAAILSFSKLWRTLVMALTWAAAYLLFTRSLALLPLAAMLGVALPGYVCARLCDPVFRALEPPAEKAGEEAPPRGDDPEKRTLV
ncbi:MAG: DUF624 domain-containing protein [Eubacteriales bacterium]|nr:DUF624 domain-containing protein [Eubacteriales bacterium]